MVAPLRLLLLPHSLGVAYLDELRRFTVHFFAEHYPGRPTHPGGRVKRWSNGVGPVGACLHYDASANGWGTVGWGVWNAQNTGSSYHATVFDGLIESVAAFLEEHAQEYPLLRVYMTAATFLHAERNKGTWNCNWANAELFGIEQRNLGPLYLRGGRYVSIQGGRLVSPMRPAVQAGKLHWEPFALDQVLATVNLCRALVGWMGDAFKPEWVLPHQCIWWSKSDTGFAYPIHQVRRLIFLSDDLVANPHAVLEKDPEFALPKDLVHHEQCTTEAPCDDIDAFDPSVETDLLADFIERGPSAEGREQDDPGSEAPDWAKIEKEQPKWKRGLPQFRAQAYAFGYHVSPVAEEDPFEVDTMLEHAALVFQKSTIYSKVDTLTRDGVPGEKTQAALAKRLAAYL